MEYQAVTSTLSLTRIPFALHTPTNTYVDVDEVPSGLKCECICPSCKSQLVAKHGDIKIHHFAHQKSDVKNDCDYSLFFSIRMMYLKLLHAKSNTTFYLPELTINQTGMTRYQQPVSVNCCLEESRAINLSLIKTDCFYRHSHYDCIAKSEMGYLAIQFNYNERPIDPDTRNTYGLNVISIDLTPLEDLFKYKDNTVSYSDLLLSYFRSKDVQVKWVFHPEEATTNLDTMLQQKIITREQELESTFLPANSEYRAAAPRTKGRRHSMTFGCTTCAHEWDARQGYLCPLCGGRGV